MIVASAVTAWAGVVIASSFLALVLMMVGNERATVLVWAAGLACVVGLVALLLIAVTG